MQKDHIRRVSQFILAVACIAFAVQIVFAHSIVKKSSPQKDEILEKAPTEVRLWLSEKCESKFSKVEVFDADDKPVHTGKPIVSEDRLQLATALQEIGAGTYQVKWQILSVDGHTTKGGISFRVKLSEEQK